MTTEPETVENPMTTDSRQQLSRLLNDIQDELERLNLWEGHPPAPKAFESSTPFCADRMDFSQWLQWVFIARFRAILAEQHPLPMECQVTPMAEEAFKELPQNTETLTALIAEFDGHF